MNTVPRASRRPRAVLALLTSAVLAVGGLLVPTVASAAVPEGTVAGASLTWGVKTSFRNYVTGKIAHGTANTVGAVTGTYTWPGGSGTAAMDGSTGTVAFGAADGVHFRGHEMNGAFALDLRFLRPRIVVTSSTAAKLVLDVTGREFKSMTEVGQEITLPNVEFATLSLPQPTASGTTYTWTNAPATLTAAGAEAFGGFYSAGTELDPVTFTLPVRAPAAATQLQVGASPANPKAGDEVTLTAHVTPSTAAGSVSFTAGSTALGASPVQGGTATLKTTKLPVGTHSVAAAFAPQDTSAFTASTAAPVTVTVADGSTEVPSWHPSVQIFRADGVTPVGSSPVYDEDTIIVKGAGFDPRANIGGRGMPVPKTQPQGNYVVFGSFAKQWQPSAGAPSSARQVVSQLWALTSATLDTVPAQFADTVRKQWVELRADGSFTAKLSVGAAASAPADGTYGVYVYAAGGMVNAAQEIGTMLNYKGERPTDIDTGDPEVGVEGPASGVIRPGDTLTFTAKGLQPEQRVRFEVHSDPVIAGTATAGATGVATLSWTVPASFATGAHEVRVLRLSDSGVPEATAFATAPFSVSKTATPPVVKPEPKPKPSVTPGGKTPTTPQPACVANTVTGGSMTWGLKQSFRSYVAGPIAKGVFTGGEFRATGGSVNLKAGSRGQITFSGTITATGHNGLLNFRLADPTVVLNGNGTGALYAQVRSTDTSGKAAVDGRVHFANLWFGGTGGSEARVSVAGASAKLTPAGAKAFASFYEAGTELDAVTFAADLGGTTTCDATADPKRSGEAGNLATTGSEISPAAAAFAGSFVLLGIALVARRRRRRV